MLHLYVGQVCRGFDQCDSIFSANQSCWYRRSLSIPSKIESRVVDDVELVVIHCGTVSEARCWVCHVCSFPLFHHRDHRADLPHFNPPPKKKLTITKMFEPLAKYQSTPHKIVILWRHPSHSHRRCVNPMNTLPLTFAQSPRGRS